MLQKFGERFLNSALHSTGNSLPNIWHLRLGHASEEVLSHVPNVHINKQNLHCETYLGAKLHRLSFNESKNVSSYRLQKLHCDVWGPYRKQSKTGAYYFLTIVDDYSKIIRAVLLQRKVQVHSAIEIFLKMIET